MFSNARGPPLGIAIIPSAKYQYLAVQLWLDGVDGGIRLFLEMMWVAAARATCPGGKDKKEKKSSTTYIHERAYN